MFKQICDLAPGGKAGQLALVMLPGAGMRARDFREQGFVAALRRRRLAVDAVMVEIDAASYVPAAFAQHLKGVIQNFLNEQGYRRVWLAGISLGAYGAMRLLQIGMQEIEGMLLLSPFLATRGTIARVRHAGGLDGWPPLPSDLNSDDADLLCWLKDNLGAGRSLPKIYLGWGMQDRYADASELLAARLPRDRVFRLPGDHDWPTWNMIWRGMLDSMPFVSGPETRPFCMPQRAGL